MSTQDSNKPFRITHPTFNIEISQHSGFCFGVVNAIKKAEDQLNINDNLYSVGSIVHNTQEVLRLSKKGLEVVNLTDTSTISNKNILFRAHGEPPESYNKLKGTNNTLIDATCPVVLKIQQRIKKAWLATKETGGQIVIFGKNNHAEVIGLLGQTNYEAILIEDDSDLENIDFTKPIALFSQTTKSLIDFNNIASAIKEKAKSTLRVNDTICRQVSNRQSQLADFAKKFDLIFFVGDPKSSNSKVLYNTCKKSNGNSFFITQPSDISSSMTQAKSIGICGATSTPQWLMEDVARHIEKLKLSK